MTKMTNKSARTRAKRAESKNKAFHILDKWLALIAQYVDLGYDRCKAILDDPTQDADDKTIASLASVWGDRPFEIAELTHYEREVIEHTMSMQLGAGARIEPAMLMSSDRKTPLVGSHVMLCIAPAEFEGKPGMAFWGWNAEGDCEGDFVPANEHGTIAVRSAKWGPVSHYIQTFLWARSATPLFLNPQYLCYNPH